MPVERCQRKKRKASKRRTERLRQFDYKFAAEVDVRFDVGAEAVEVGHPRLNTEHESEIHLVQVPLLLSAVLLETSVKRLVALPHVAVGQSKGRQSVRRLQEQKRFNAEVTAPTLN